MTHTDSFRTAVETFLSDTQMPVSEFGRRALNNSNFVSLLRLGRSPTLATADKVCAFITAWREENGIPESRPKAEEDASGKAA